jgi:hypothetical protein
MYGGGAAVEAEDDIGVGMEIFSLAAFAPVDEFVKKCKLGLLCS